MAAYHPQGTLPIGVNTNIDLHRYMASAVGLLGKPDELTQEYFVPHTELLKGYKYTILPAKTEKDNPTLVVKGKKQQLTIVPFTNIIRKGKKANDEIRLSTVIVYVDKNNTFYLPRSITKYLE